MNEKNELVPVNYEFQVQKGRFELVGYNELFEQVEQLGEFLGTIAVTTENIQQNKKLVAQVRKICDGLNQKKTEFKKRYMEPYLHLDRQIKLLTGRVSDYENLVRSQIRDLEEQERREKKEAIRDIFDRRSPKFGDVALFPFDAFLENRHLNKSVSINKVEKEMVEWFTKRKSEIITIENFAIDKGQDFVTMYKYYNDCDSLSQTINHFQRIENERQQVMQALDTQPRLKEQQKSVKEKQKSVKEQRSTEDQRYVLIQIKEEDNQLAQDLLEATGIGYKIIYPKPGL